MAVRFQLTRPVWGEPYVYTNLSKNQSISTHSPRVGRTDYFTSALPEPQNFNSLAPCGANRDEYYYIQISIYFNSLAPCGANLKFLSQSRPIQSFQLTRPVWGEP